MPLATEEVGPCNTILIIRNGTVIDGSGMARYRADVGIAGGTIATIGKIRDQAREVIDAEGHVVAPGLIDGHTHMDAQVFWDPIGTCSCWHGVTSVVMGNCGFSLAPCAEKDKLLVMRNLERAEDISPRGDGGRHQMVVGNLRAVPRRRRPQPQGNQLRGVHGHSALRTYVMGERAFSDEATPDDLTAMKREVRDAIRAGAIGFTTSRTCNHETADRRPVASRLANWEEVRQLVGVMGELNAGVFEIAGEETGPIRSALATTSTGSRRWPWIPACRSPSASSPTASARLLASIFRAGRRDRAGGRAHVCPGLQAAGVDSSFETHLPFDRFPVWRDIRKLPLAEQEAALRNPETRRKLVAAAHAGAGASMTRAVGAERAHRSGASGGCA